MSPVTDLAQRLGELMSDHRLGVARLITEVVIAGLLAAILLTMQGGTNATTDHAGMASAIRVALTGDADPFGPSALSELESSLERLQTSVDDIRKATYELCTARLNGTAPAMDFSGGDPCSTTAVSGAAPGDTTAPGVLLSRASP